jgi:hypothetical protein
MTNRNHGESERERIVKIHSHLIIIIKVQAEGASSDGGRGEEGKWRTKVMRPSILMVGRFSLETLNVVLLPLNSV